MRAIQVIKSIDPKFSDNHPDQQYNLRSACSLGIGGLHSCHSVCILAYNRNNRPIIEGQGPAELAEIVRFLFGIVLTLTGVCQEMKQ